jgi:hypothetical protein
MKNYKLFPTNHIKQGKARALELQDVEAPSTSRQSAHEGAQIVIPTHRPPLSQTVILGRLFIC